MAELDYVPNPMAKAFRSGLQPVELGRKVVRALDDGRTLGVRGTVAPNHLEIALSAEDAERFAGFGDALARAGRRAAGRLDRKSVV